MHMRYIIIMSVLMVSVSVVYVRAEEQVQAASDVLDEQQESSDSDTSTDEETVSDTSESQATPVQEQVQPVTDQAPAPVPMPTPVQPSPPAPVEEKVEIVGIDTVDVSEPKGNWLYKRIWWERAERLYEKIQQMVTQIHQAPTVFFSRRSELDRNVLDPFYLNVGLSEGELNQVLAHYMQELEKERAEFQVLDEKERLFLVHLKDEKKNLETLHGSVQTIAKFDKAVDAALARLIEQVNAARNYENQAWASFKSINRELSDKKARELYYAMDAYWKNVNNINTYIAGQYTQYFDDLIKKIYQETENVKSSLNGLKEKGIDIRKQGQELIEGSPKKTQAERDEDAEKEERGFVNLCWNGLFYYLTLPFEYAKRAYNGVISWVAGLFGGSADVEPQPEKRPEVVTPTQSAKPVAPAPQAAVPKSLPGLQIPATKP